METSRPIPASFNDEANALWTRLAALIAKSRAAVADPLDLADEAERLMHEARIVRVNATAGAGVGLLVATERRAARLADDLRSTVKAAA